MEEWRVWLRKHKTVSSKYHILQFSCRPRLTRVYSDRRNMTGPEPSWGGKRYAQIHTKENKKETHREGVCNPDMQRERWREHEALQLRRRTWILSYFGYWRELEKGSMKICRTLHLINLAKVVTGKEPLRNCKSSLVISWLGTGVARVLRMNASKPMVGWKGTHPQLVSWL